MRDEISRPTTSELVMERFVGAAVYLINHPEDFEAVRMLGKRRRALEAYHKILERMAGVVPQKKRGRKQGAAGGGARGSGRGYTLRRQVSGNWTAQCTWREFRRGKSFGTVSTKLEADNLGREGVAKLRGEAA